MDYFNDPEQWPVYLKPPPGTNIYRVAELVLEASKTNLRIKGFLFNEVTVRVSQYKEDTAEGLVQRYHEKLEKDRLRR